MSDIEWYPEYQALADFAKSIGVTFNVTDKMPPKSAADQLDGLRDHGPVGGGCDLLTRTVWIEELRPHELLHEVMHVYLAFPYLPLAMQPDEGRCLMQVERRLAKKLLDPDEYRCAVDWQMQTGTNIFYAALEMEYATGSVTLYEVPGYARSYGWRRGFLIARKLGVLSASGEPTMALPDWNALTPEDKAWMTFKTPRELKHP